MITSKNVQDVLRLVSEEDVHKVNTGYFEEYLLLEVFSTNTRSSASLQCLRYDEDTYQDAVANGQLFCDADSFLQIMAGCDLARSWQTTRHNSSGQPGNGRGFYHFHRYGFFGC